MPAIIIYYVLCDGICRYNMFVACVDGVYVHILGGVYSVVLICICKFDASPCSIVGILPELKMHR